MSRDRLPLLLWLAAALAAVGCVVSWLASRSTATVAPILAGEPETTSVLHSPPLIALSLVCATAAGVLAVLASSRPRR